MCGEDTGLIASLHDDRPCTITPKNAITTISPVGYARHGLSPHHQRASGCATFNKVICRCHCINKTTADCLYIKCRATGDAEFVLHEAGGTGENTVWRGRCNNDQVNLAGLYTSRLDSVAASLQCQITGEFVICHNMPLTNTGAGKYPLIRGIHHALKVSVGHDFCRQIATGSGNTRILHACSFKTVSGVPADLACGCKCSISNCSVILRKTPLRASSIAVWMACKKENLSAPPWLFTTIPRKPRKLAPL